jgi:hypothetical protein
VIDVVTDLLGEIVEVYEWNDGSSLRGGSSYCLRGRGTVRAVLVEHNLGYDSVSYGDRTKDCGFEIYALHEGRGCVGQRCVQCGGWDQKSLLGVWSEDNAWEHKSGEGCKKVGSGG